MGKTFVISISFFSEPNYQGNCSKYYLKNLAGKKFSYAGIAVSKHYKRILSANKAAAKLREMYPTAKVEVEERTFTDRLNKR